jgi:hypothetical protein
MKNQKQNQKQNQIRTLIVFLCCLLSTLPAYAQEQISAQQEADPNSSDQV